MKDCIKCKKTFELSDFHKHKGMKDGHLNKCKYCVVIDVAEWRLKNTGCRQRERVRLRERLGHSTREEYFTKRRENAIGRKVSSVKYAYKRRRFIEAQSMSELDEFVLEQAINLSQLREESTGIQWHIDHIVPLYHKEACGLHSYSNLQVVPASWNCKKGNRNMNTYVKNT